MGPYYIIFILHRNCLGTIISYNFCILHNALADIGLYVFMRSTSFWWKYDVRFSIHVHNLKLYFSFAPLQLPLTNTCIKAQSSLIIHIQSTMEVIKWFCNFNGVRGSKYWATLGKGALQSYTGQWDKEIELAIKCNIMWQIDKLGLTGSRILSLPLGLKMEGGVWKLKFRHLPAGLGPHNPRNRCLQYHTSCV
jgi:hypothetical protein